MLQNVPRLNYILIFSENFRFSTIIQIHFCFEQMWREKRIRKKGEWNR